MCTIFCQVLCTKNRTVYDTIYSGVLWKEKTERECAPRGKKKEKGWRRYWHLILGTNECAAKVRISRGLYKHTIGHTLTHTCESGMVGMNEAILNWSETRTFRLLQYDCCRMVYCRSHCAFFHITRFSESCGIFHIGDGTWIFVS